MPDSFSYCEQRVREADKDRFLATLFARPDKRPALFALYAFDFETAAIPWRVREPLAGEMRLQWWREVLQGERREEALASPISAALHEALQQHGLAPDRLLGMLEARASELYREPFSSIADFDAHARETAGAVLQLAAEILDPGCDVTALESLVRSAATALSATAALRSFAADAARARLAVPLALLLEHGATPDQVYARQATPGLLAALAAFRAHARTAAEQARRLLPSFPVVAPAFLPALLSPLYLDRMEARGYDPFTSLIDVPQWRRQWRLFREAHRAKA